MRAGFVIMVDEKFLGLTAKGNIGLFDSIAEVEKLNSYSEALFVASTWLTFDWQIIEVAPNNPEPFHLAFS